MSLSSLPPELLHEILIYLPISNLLAFARTSKENFTTSTLALQTLHLAVLPRRIYGVLTFLNSLHLDDNDHVDVYDDVPSLHQITIPSELPIHLLEGSKKSGALRPRKPTMTPAQYRQQLFALQNKLACSVLSTSALSKIQTLSLHLYEITSPELTTVLATSFDSLRNLHLNFSHPYLHDTCLPAHYWTSPIFLKGSPIWNPLAGLGDLHAATLKLRTLETLIIERAGITSVQLRRWIEQNPRLRQITLRNVLGVDHDFVEWLGEYYSHETRSSGGVGKKEIPARLEKLALEHCSSLILKSRADFTWLDSLFNLTSRSDDENLANQTYCIKPKCLQILSLLGSSSNAVYTNSLLAYLEEGKPTVKQVTLPDGRILIARNPQLQRHRILARDGLHTRGTAARNASTRSLNDVEAEGELEVDAENDSDDGDDGSSSEIQACDRKPGSVSFLCEKKSSTLWKGRWSVSNNGGRGSEGIPPFQPGNGAIEVDERHAALHRAEDDVSRLLRPVVKRSRS
jgi:hypothetical protein